MKKNSSVRIDLNAEENFALIKKSEPMGISKRKLAKRMMRAGMIHFGLLEATESDREQGLVK